MVAWAVPFGIFGVQVQRSWSQGVLLAFEGGTVVLAAAGAGGAASADDVGCQEEDRQAARASGVVGALCLARTSAKVWVVPATTERTSGALSSVLRGNCQT